MSYLQKIIDALYFFFSFRRIHRLTDVYVPGDNAKKTFVEREAIGKSFELSLETPGKQIVVYGKSGSGKSTVINAKFSIYFDDKVGMVCTSDTTYEELLKSAFDDLELYVTTQKSKTNQYLISSEGKAKSSVLEAKTLFQSSESSQNLNERVITYQISENKLARALKEKNVCWIIEDFHLLGIDVKNKLARCLKVFTDLGAKMIIAGIVGSPKELLLYNTELTNRLSEFYVPLMSESELHSIITAGEKLLNVEFEDNCKNVIVKLSNGYAGVCHQLCLNMCWVNDIKSTQRKKKILGLGDLSETLYLYIGDKTDSFKKNYVNAFIRSEEGINYAKQIILSYFRTGQDVMNLQQFKYDFKKNVKEYSYDLFAKSLDDLVKKGVLDFNEIQSKYSISNPIFHVYCYINLKDEIDTINKERLREEVNKFQTVNLEKIQAMSFSTMTEIIPALMNMK
ncbi:hypothetical protein [Lewinella sp. LCG006]|uniref:hypothetical protein n=1 Tax=Lewinella sp. LCG006 TaxID=3231911 RepID=UPI0034613F56